MPLTMIGCGMRRADIDDRRRRCLGKNGWLEHGDRAARRHGCPRADRPGREVAYTHLCPDAGPDGHDGLAAVCVREATVLKALGITGYRPPKRPGQRRAPPTGPSPSVPYAFATTQPATVAKKRSSPSAARSACRKKGHPWLMIGHTTMNPPGPNAAPPGPVTRSFDARSATSANAV